MLSISVMDRQVKLLLLVALTMSVYVWSSDDNQEVRNSLLQLQKEQGFVIQQSDQQQKLHAQERVEKGRFTLKDVFFLGTCAAGATLLVLIGVGIGASILKRDLQKRYNDGYKTCYTHFFSHLVSENEKGKLLDDVLYEIAEHN